MEKDSGLLINIPNIPFGEHIVPIDPHNLAAGKRSVSPELPLRVFGLDKLTKWFNQEFSPNISPQTISINLQDILNSKTDTQSPIESSEKEEFPANGQEAIKRLSSFWKQVTRTLEHDLESNIDIDDSRWVSYNRQIINNRQITDDRQITYGPINIEITFFKAENPKDKDSKIHNQSVVVVENTLVLGWVDRPYGKLEDTFTVYPDGSFYAKFNHQPSNPLSILHTKYPFNLEYPPPVVLSEPIIHAATILESCCRVYLKSQTEAQK